MIALLVFAFVALLSLSGSVVAYRWLIHYATQRARREGL